MRSLAPRPIAPPLGLLGLSLLLASPAYPQTARMVRDINPSSQIPERVNSYPLFMTEMGNASFFANDDGVHGLELWVSDGTVLGTHILRDICPGSCSDLPPKK